MKRSSTMTYVPVHHSLSSAEDMFVFNSPPLKSATGAAFAQAPPQASSSLVDRSPIPPIPQERETLPPVSTSGRFDITPSALQDLRQSLAAGVKAPSTSQSGNNIPTPHPTSNPFALGIPGNKSTISEQGHRFPSSHNQQASRTQTPPPTPNK